MAMAGEVVADVGGHAQKLEVQRHLNKLNKPAVKSIKVTNYPFFLILYY